MGSEIHNRMARFAFKQVSEISDENKEKKKEFRSLARSMPSYIQVNGLGAAIAFLYSKKKTGYAHGKMYEMLTRWIESDDCLLPPKKDDFMECIVNLDGDSYRLYVNEIMNLCQWIKRFAEGRIEGDAEPVHE